MNETERKAYLEQFNRRTHVLGRIVSAITLVLLVGAPFLIGTFLGAMPDMGAVAQGLFVRRPRVDGQQCGGVSHLHAHARRWRRLPRLHHRQPHQYEDPVRGQCARYRRHQDRHGRKRDHLDALDRDELARDHRRARARRGAARAAAAVLQSPVLQPAFANVVPALFGAMAYQYFRKNVQVAVAPLVVMSLLFMLVPSLTSSTSFMIIPSGALAIGIAYSMYRKQKKEADVK